MRKNERLDRECLAFARYLTRQPPTDYTVEKYGDAHARSELLRADRASRFDVFLLTIARTHPLGAWLVDTYTAVFLRRALVRRKWVLLLAILESSAPSADYFDVPDAGGRPVLAARLVLKGAGFVFALVVAMVMFMPVHLLIGSQSR